MMEGILALFLTWMCISLVAGFWLSINYIVTESPWDLFWLPNKVSADWCEENEMNKVGQCILDIWFNIIMFPTMIIATLIIGIFYTFAFFIILFTWIFRKR